MGTGGVGLIKEFGEWRIVYKSAEWAAYARNGGGRMTFSDNPFYASAEFNWHSGKWVVSKGLELLAWVDTREAALMTLDGLCALEGYS
jgi:hypothetical protein